MPVELVPQAIVLLVGEGEVAAVVVVPERVDVHHLEVREGA